MKTVLSVFLLSLGGMFAFGAQTVYRADLSGAQEVPAVTTDFSGTARVVLSADGSMLNVVVLHNVPDASAAHIHLGAAGENGPVFFDLGSAASPITASVPLTDEDREDLRNGNFYFNVHTPGNPGGEIRGQIGGGIPAALYRVTITNLTKSQIFSPPLVASHSNAISLAQVGGTASPGLQTMAEEGNPLQLLMEAGSSPAVLSGAAAGGPVMPGQSVTVELMVSADFPYISAAGMLVTTNDAFFFANSVNAPRLTPFPPFKNNTNNNNGRAMVMAQAYDAGTEVNNEACDSIPGPPCGSAGAAAGDGEGFIYLHNGIHGIGDLDTATWDWRGPVARVMIEATEVLPLSEIPFKE